MPRSLEKGLKVRNKKAGFETGFFVSERPERLGPLTEGVN
ncbi:MAG: hypothetical protein RL298_394 [Pseudomonadota bacterium]